MNGICPHQHDHSKAYQNHAHIYGIYFIKTLHFLQDCLRNRPRPRPSLPAHPRVSSPKWDQLSHSLGCSKAEFAIGLHDVADIYCVTEMEWSNGVLSLPANKPLMLQHELGCFLGFFKQPNTHINDMTATKLKLKFRQNFSQHQFKTS